MLEQQDAINAVIVLANLMDRDGKLNDESLSRAAKAVAVFWECKAKVLVTCGWSYRNDTSLTIADAFYEHIVGQYQFPRERIVVERNSRDTVGDAVFTKMNLALPMQWKKVIVVTSGYHVARTKTIFDFVYGVDIDVKVLAADMQNNETLLSAEAQSLAAFQNTFVGVKAGDNMQILDRLRTRHPFYNGEVYSKI